jgi:hypothetical protein
MKVFLLLFLSICSLGDSHPLLPEALIDEPQNKIDLTSLGVGLFSDPDESVGKLVSDWTPEHNQNPEELGSYLEGDMLVPGIEGRNGLVKQSSRWPNGVVPYVISPNIGSADQRMIESAIAEYHAKTCIRFVRRSSEQDFLSFESSNTGCWSSVGRIGKKQSINLQSPGCTTKVGTP